jgi:hypothetical protein
VKPVQSAIKAVGMAIIIIVVSLGLFVPRASAQTLLTNDALVLEVNNIMS